LLLLLLFCVVQRELELIAEALRIPGSKSLGPVSKVRVTCYVTVWFATDAGADVP
jgi:hypothetical protein